MKKSWFDTLDISITVCNSKGKIIYMNRKSEDGLKKYGGYNLIGQSLYDCHSENSRDIIRSMIKEQKENIYITEKSGIKTLICQKPVYDNTRFKGIMEIAIDLPPDMAILTRD